MKCRKVNISSGGLSPLARGTLRPGRTGHHYHRFIPAGAGNTKVVIEPLANLAVYPRWRGEHVDFPVPVLPIIGLSPLARGTLAVLNAVAISSRFIPAGAGNTLELVAERQEIAVYPRWRGEHANAISGVLFSPGLSPLARGTRRANRCCGQHARFIPAGAGNTLNGYNCL